MKYSNNDEINLEKIAKMSIQRSSYYQGGTFIGGCAGQVIADVMTNDLKEP